MFPSITSRLRGGAALRKTFYLALAVSTVSVTALAQHRAGASPLSFRSPLSAQQAVAPQNPVEAAPLELEKFIEREVAGGQKHSYQITLAAGQYASVIVEQRGSDVVARLIGPQGKLIVEADDDARLKGQEKIELVADLAGSYRLEVEPRQPKAGAGSYTIRLADRREATEKDRALEQARGLFAESYKLLRSGKYDQALGPGERALALREQWLGPEHTEVAASLNHLAEIHRVSGNHAKAEPLYQRALAIREKALGPEHPQVATTINNLAWLYRQMGNYAKAEALFQRALQIREKVLGPEHADVASLLNNLAILYRMAGNFGKAEQLSLRSLRIKEKVLGPEHPEIAASLNNLAGLYFQTGDYAKAEPLMQRALQIRERAQGPEHPDVATSLNNLAILYSQTGDHVKAEPLFQQALQIREKALGPEHPDVAASLNNLAILYREVGDYAKAEPLYQRSLRIKEKVLGPEHPDVATSLHNLAALYTQTGDYGKAESLNQRAIEMQKKILGPEHPDVAASLHEFAILYTKTGDYARAESLFQQALAIGEKSQGAEHPDVAASLNSLAIVYTAKGELERAVSTQRRANAIIERNIALNLVTGSERRKLAYLASLPETTDRTLSLHARTAPGNAEALELAVTTVLQRKGRVQDAMGDSLAALRSRSSAEDRELLDRLSETTAQLAQLVLNGPRRISPAEHQRQIKTLAEQREKLEGEISRRSAGYYERSEPVTLAAVQKAIPDQAALIEFAVYRAFAAQAPADKAFGEPRYVAYVVRRDSVRGQDLGEAKAIDDCVAALRQALGDPQRKDVQALARQVDAKVIQPLRAHLGDATQLLVSPDGALNLIPFEALVDEAGKYLIERYAFSYLTGGRDLLRLQVARASKSPAVVLADPLFGEPEETAIAPAMAPHIKPVSLGRKRQSVTTGEDLSRVYFAPLAGTAREALAIKSLFPDARVLEGPQATESALKRVDVPRLLHIATHGFFLQNAADPLSNAAAPQSRNASVKIENPLLRSGLALAGANLHKGSADDGILTALEATGLNLWGTKLVVLSACDTGVGEVKNGEGVYGLRRAFVLAGTESLVMSLWPVSDYVTRELMTAYYRGLKQGQGRGAALRQVQQGMLKRKGHEHPFYWASFIQSGEWASLDGKR